MAVGGCKTCIAARTLWTTGGGAAWSLSHNISAWRKWAWYLHMHHSVASWVSWQEQGWAYNRWASHCSSGGNATEEQTKHWSFCLFLSKCGQFDWHPKVVRLSHVLVQAAQLRECRPMQLFLDSDCRRPHQKLNPGSFACLRISNLHLHTFICEWLQVPPGLNMHQNLLM